MQTPDSVGGIFDQLKAIEEQSSEASKDQISAVLLDDVMDKIEVKVEFVTPKELEPEIKSPVKLQKIVCEDDPEVSGEMSPLSEKQKTDAMEAMLEHRK